MFLTSSLHRFAVTFFLTFAVVSFVHADEPTLQFERFEIVEGEAEWEWTQARTGLVPNGPAITTMSRTSPTETHGYYDIYASISEDGGDTWGSPELVQPLRRLRNTDGYEVVGGDLWPTWHAESQRILITGKTFNFDEGVRENFLREKISYASWDPATGESSELRTVEMPSRDHRGLPILAPNAGCCQRVDLPNGDILLPVRYQTSVDDRVYTSTVARMQFDGETLRYLEHGSEHSVESGRGLYEPSLTQLNGIFLLTLRADDDAYVAISKDGLHFEDHQRWKYDDGASLNSYNTQQHWVTVGGRVYLVYTRRGADNDHIFRHRAPLFIAEVDVDTQRIKRQTEHVLLEENHATLGNFGICQVGNNECWLTVGEGRVQFGERRGERNKVWLVKIHAATQ